MNHVSNIYNTCMSGDNIVGKFLISRKDKSVDSESKDNLGNSLASDQRNSHSNDDGDYSDANCQKEKGITYTSHEGNKQMVQSILENSDADPNLNIIWFSC